MAPIDQRAAVDRRPDSRGRRAAGSIGAVTDSLDGITPLPTVPSVKDAFDKWAEDAITVWHTLYAEASGKPRFVLAEFDGCTFAPDVARPCCLLHDLACYYGAQRWVADRLFRDCIVDLGQHEDRFGGFWTAVGWTYWAGVRGFYRAKQLLQTRKGTE